MFTLIIGGSASGKSEYAERHVLSLPGHRIYIASMQPFGAEAALRIRKHRAARRGKGFQTIERYTDLRHLEIPDDSNVLLEDLGNLTANEMFSPEGGGAEAALQGILSLRRKSLNLTVVTNEVFSGGDAYGEETIRYMKELARLSCTLAKEADLVAEIVCGLPNILKEPEKCGAEEGNDIERRRLWIC